MKGCLGVKGMGHMVRPPVRRPVCLFRGSRGVADGNPDPRRRRLPDKGFAAFPFRSYRDQFHSGKIPSGQHFQFFHGWICKKLLPLGAGLALVKERSLHMRAQHPGALRLRPFHHRPDALNRPARFFRVRAHRRRAEGTHAELQQCPAHGPHRFLPLHGVAPAEGVNMHVHKPGQQKIPAQVRHVFSRFRPQIPAGFRNPAVQKTHVRFPVKIPSVIHCSIPYQHIRCSNLLFFLSPIGYRI